MKFQLTDDEDADPHDKGDKNQANYQSKLSQADVVVDDDDDDDDDDEDDNNNKIDLQLKFANVTTRKKVIKGLQNLGHS